MLRNRISDFKPGQVIEVIGGYSPNFSVGTIGVVYQVPKMTAVYSYSTEALIREKNTTTIEFFYRPGFGNGMRLSSNIHINNVRILDCFYYFDFEHNKVVRHELSSTIDSFGYYLLRNYNFFASEDDASRFGFSQNRYYEALKKIDIDG